MNEETTNPVKRLLRILKKAQNSGANEKYFKVLDQSLSSDFIEKAGHNNLNKEVNKIKDFHLKLINFIMLIEEIENMIRESPEINDEVYLKDFHYLWKLIEVLNYDIPWNNISANLTPTLFTSLNFCDDAISKSYNEKEINENDLLYFLDEINSLIIDITGSDIDIELKTFILELLKQIYNSILNYNINGIKGLYKTVLDTFIRVKTYQEMHKGIENNDRFAKAKDFITKFGKTVKDHIPHAYFTQKILEDIKIEDILKLTSGS